MQIMPSELGAQPSAMRSISFRLASRANRGSETRRRLRTSCRAFSSGAVRPEVEGGGRRVPVGMASSIFRLVGTSENCIRSSQSSVRAAANRAAQLHQEAPPGSECPQAGNGCKASGKPKQQDCSVSDWHQPAWRGKRTSVE